MKITEFRFCTALIIQNLLQIHIYLCLAVQNCQKSMLLLAWNDKVAVLAICLIHSHHLQPSQQGSINTFKNWK